MVEISELMSLPEAVKALGITRASVYRAIERGEIEAIRMGDRQLLTRASVESYVPRAYAGRPGSKPKGRPKKQEVSE